MSVLSADGQKQIEKSLVDEGYITQALLERVKNKAEQESEPFFGLLVSDGHVSSEVLTKLIAKINHVLLS